LLACRLETLLGSQDPKPISQATHREPLMI
jgi:hypothetical protein